MPGYGTIGIGFMFWDQTPDEGTTDMFVQIKSRFDTYAESIHRILQTSPLERPHEPNVGAIVRRVLFDPNDFYLRRTLDYTIRDAIVNQEPRLSIVSIEFDVLEQEKKVIVHLQLMETETQARFVVQEELQL